MTTLCQPDANTVARYDGQSLTYLTTEDGLVGNGVVEILEDEAGNLWFGTREEGRDRGASRGARMFLARKN